MIFNLITNKNYALIGRSVNYIKNMLRYRSLGFCCQLQLGSILFLTTNSVISPRYCSALSENVTSRLITFYNLISSGDKNIITSEFINLSITCLTFAIISFISFTHRTLLFINPLYSPFTHRSRKNSLCRLINKHNI